MGMISAAGTDWFTVDDNTAHISPADLSWCVEIRRRLDRAGVACRIERAPYGRKWDRWVVVSLADIETLRASEHAAWLVRHNAEAAQWEVQLQAARAAQAAQGPVEVDW